jgi:putative ABC transport system permease protein
VNRAAVIARLAWRETRASRRRLFLFASSISVGVAALVAIASFTANIQESVRGQSRELLGGDLVLGSNRPFGAAVTALVDSLRASGFTVARETRFASMAYVRRTEGIRLADVRAVGPEWPLYGRVRTEPAGQWGRLARERVAIVDTALLVALDARIGDSLALGNESFLIVAVAAEVPGRLSTFEGFGSQVFIPRSEVPRMGLVTFGSRVRHTAYLRTGDERQARHVVATHRRVFDQEKVRAETAGDFQSDVTDALQNLSSFLQFVGLIALLLGGIGVASGVGAFVAGKLETIAVLRCLGASRPLVFAIYLSQAAALGLVGAAVGALLGLAVQAALPHLLTGVLPVDVHVALEPSAVLAGLGIGLAVALLFALRPLLEVRRVSPLQALRRAYETEDPGPRGRDPLRLVAFGALAIGVFVIAMGRAEQPRVGVGFAVAIGVSVGMLTLAARLTVWLARRLSRLRAIAARWPYVLRQGLANLHRPRNQTRAVVTALGFGVTVLATLYLVQANLLRQVSLATLRAGGRANLVFIDIQPDQAAGVDSLVRAAGLPVLQRVPIVPMRIATLNGLVADSVRRLPPERRPASWAMRRDYRSTYRDSGTTSETVLQGSWWGDRTEGPPWPVSLSREVSEDLKVSLGDTIVWNVQGLMVPTRVAMVREVDWARFEPNFFAVFPTAALERAPHTIVLLTRADEAGARARLQRAVAGRFSNVTSYDVALLQRLVERIFGRVALAIRFMAVLSLATGTLVLLGAVAAGRLQRIREGALLKTLGATRRQLTRILLAEYLALGLLAGVMGIALSIGGAWAMTHWVLQLSFTVPVLPLAAVLVVTAGLVALVGMASSREVFRRTAVEVLRDA